MTDREVLAAAVRARNEVADCHDRIDWLEDSADAMAHLLTRIGREVPLPEGVREQTIRLVELHESGMQFAEPASAAILFDALRLIAGDRCSTFVGGARCSDGWSGRTRGAKYGADAWCDACIARDALVRAGAES